jgi:hypothetical protein
MERRINFFKTAEILLIKNFIELKKDISVSDVRPRLSENSSKYATKFFINSNLLINQGRFKTETSKMKNYVFSSDFSDCKVIIIFLLIQILKTYANFEKTENE